MKYFYGIILASLFFMSCDKDDKKETYLDNLPTTYNFTNVSYQGQQDRLSMLSEMVNYMKSGTGSELDLTKLNNMFVNENNEFSQAYTKQLKSKTFPAAQDVFGNMLSEVVRINGSRGQAAQQGQAGVATSTTNATKKYLVNENGVEYAQLFAKGMMGALLYYQGTAVYLGSDRMNVDNETVTEGKGTKMQHHWDEAFGYLGVAKDFPANTDGSSFWGGYSTKRANAILGTDKKLMDAFILGRAAIGAKDLEKRDEAIATIREQWELVAVSAALHYLNAVAEIDDNDAVKIHELSEALGFIYSLQFNPSKKISQAKMESFLTELVGSTDFTEMNGYNTTKEKLISVRDQLADIYKLADKKDQF